MINSARFPIRCKIHRYLNWIKNKINIFKSEMYYNLFIVFYRIFVMLCICFWVINLVRRKFNDVHVWVIRPCMMSRFDGQSLSVMTCWYVEFWQAQRSMEIINMKVICWIVLNFVIVTWRRLDLMVLSDPDGFWWNAFADGFELPLNSFQSPKR